MEINEKPVVKDCLTTEKPRYLKSIITGVIVECTGLGKYTDCFSGVVVYQGLSNVSVSLGHTSDTWVTSFFEPCDYTPPQTVEEYEAQGMEKFAFEFVTQGKVTPETEQHRTPLEKVLSTALNEVKAMHKYSLKLQQENANLKEQQQNSWNDKKTFTNALARIAELEAQLAAKNEPSTEPKEHVYDINWLSKVVKKYSHLYLLSKKMPIIVFAMCIDSNNGIGLEPKESAHIIIAALAKEFNGTWLPDWTCEQLNKYCITPKGVKYVQTSNYGQAVFKYYETAQKAIDIINGIEPQILKNCFQ